MLKTTPKKAADFFGFGNNMMYDLPRATDIEL
jgi:hypothetical protein